MAICMFDSQNSFYKDPFGAVPTGRDITLRLRLPGCQQEHRPLVLLQEADCPQPAAIFALEPQGEEGDWQIYRTTLSVPEPGLYFYHFEITLDEERKALRREDGTPWQLTVYEESFATPDFLKRGVVYQIFPDRFAKSGLPHQAPEDRILRQDWGALPKHLPDQDGEFRCNDYFGGDLAGIREKLPYLQSLGVTALYLNPIFEAHSNHRYNTADYLKIDPLLGTEEDFRALCADAKKRGISIILDGVFSHTGSDSLYFNREGRYGQGGAYRDQESPYSPWYGFRHWPDQYDSWWGFLTLPNVDECNCDYRAFICGENGVLRHWIDAGASGFRLDVADELPDLFLDDLRRCVKAGSPDCAVIGEVWEDASNKESYSQRRRYLLGGQLDSVMNYPFREAILDYVRRGNGLLFRQRVLAILENYPKPVLDCLMTSLSTHDVERAVTVLAGENAFGRDRSWQAAHHHLSKAAYQRGRQLLMLASLLQYALPGIPCLYYGDEAGLTGYRDPFNRCCYPWGKEDMGLVDFFRLLGQLRTKAAPLTGGSFTLLEAGDSCATLLREGGGQRLYVAVNRGDRPAQPLLPQRFFGLAPLLVLGSWDGQTLSPLGGVALLDTAP